MRGVYVRGHRLKKFIQAITLLSQPCGATLEELGHKLEIQKRQVYRLLESLQDDFCFILHEEPLEGGGKRVSIGRDQQKRLADMKVPDMNLTMSEIVALHFLRSHAKLFQGTEIGDEIEQAFSKLSVFVPEGLGERVERVKSLWVPAGRFTKDYSGKEELIDTLANAILSQKTCNVTYHSFSDDKIKHFSIDPLHFFERDGGLYVFIRSSSFGDILTLAVERIQGLETTPNTFNYPDDFCPEELLEKAFGAAYDDPIEVSIWFSADQARYIQERIWAKDQKITPNSDGSIVLWMNTSGWFDVKRWIISFGSEAELLTPKTLREDMLQELQGAVAKYL